MRSRNKKKPLRRLPSKRLLAVVFILLISSVGAYFVFKSQAFDDDRHLNMESSHPADHIQPGNLHLPPGAMVTGHIVIQATSGDNDQGIVDTPAYQAIAVISYNTQLFKFVSGNCGWQYGCAKSNGDSFDRPYHNLHKARIAICFNVPANANIMNEQAFTYTFQRTSGTTNDEPTYNQWTVFGRGHAEGTCESNPNASGVVWDGQHGFCNDGSVTCDDGNGPGAGPGILTGMGGKGNGTGPGGGGGGGSSAKKQGDSPNTIPSSSAQGDTKQTTLEPSPFFDGKQYEPGSDPDLLGVNTTFSVAGHSLKYGWVYVVGLLTLVCGASYYVRKKHPELLKKLKILERR